MTPPPMTSAASSSSSSTSTPSASAPTNDPGMTDLLKNARKSRISPLWSALTQKAKDDVKLWFVDRANKKGVPFSKLIDFFRAHRGVVEQNYHELWNVDVFYPDYYTQAFHGYESGNLCFEAAEDCLPATFSTSVTYWAGISPSTATGWIRQNFTDALVEYIQHVPHHDDGNPATIPTATSMPKKIVDFGGSVGMSSKYLLENFDGSHVSLVDLSPHFLATAKMWFETGGSIMQLDDTSRISYHHQLAEQSGFDTNSQDLVSMSFLVHELPPQVALSVFREAKRILKPGGVIAILDLDPHVLDRLPVVRKFLFGLTEPHLNMYLKGKPSIPELLGEAGFVDIDKRPNDRMNYRLFGRNPVDGGNP